MPTCPPVTHDDPEYLDDPSIPDCEILWRGLLGEHMPDGPSGPVSSAAFKTRQSGKIRRHISTFRKSLAEAELDQIWEKLRLSVALCDIQVGHVRGLWPEIVGVCDAGGLKSHTRMIRNRSVSDEDWQVVAVCLAQAARVSMLRDGSSAT